MTMQFTVLRQVPLHSRDVDAMLELSLRAVGQLKSFGFEGRVWRLNAEFSGERLDAVSIVETPDATAEFDATPWLRKLIECPA